MELQLIQTKIYPVREQNVMLDTDLTELYGIETKRLKEAVKRNFSRFPGDFCVSADEGRKQFFKVANFDLKKWQRKTLQVFNYLMKQNKLIEDQS